MEKGKGKGKRGLGVNDKWAAHTFCPEISISTKEGVGSTSPGNDAENAPVGAADAPNSKMSGASQPDTHAHTHAKHATHATLLHMHTPVPLPGLTKSLPSASYALKRWVWPVITISASSCRCSALSASASPQGTTWPRRQRGLSGVRLRGARPAGEGGRARRIRSSPGVHDTTQP